MEMESLKDLYIEELKDLYSAENQLPSAKNLPSSNQPLGSQE